MLPCKCLLNKYKVEEESSTAHVGGLHAAILTCLKKAIFKYRVRWGRQSLNPGVGVHREKCEQRSSVVVHLESDLEIKKLVISTFGIYHENEMCFIPMKFAIEIE